MKFLNILINNIIMKRIVFYVALALLLSSCATYKLEKTIWTNVSFVEKEGTKAAVITSIYFTSDSTIDLCKTVRIDTMEVVSPFIFAKGSYRTEGNPRKDAKIFINAKSIESDLLNFKGVYYKDYSMILVSEDSITKLYGRVPEVKLP